MAAALGAKARLGPALRELRIHLCQRSAESRGVRDFIEKHYVALKKANPTFPVLIRECSAVQPKLWARYGERPGGQRPPRCCSGTGSDYTERLSAPRRESPRDLVETGEAVRVASGVA
uniref:NADH dehydrogenase [ubiquinone] 1 alpha subcomplex subunit 2 n=1 Tax=Ornithorhynchus anatinus TaxID=9258 RepID=A0A6I8PM63_ORNAN